MSKYMFRRYLLFVVSLFINAFGIAFITKALLGTSPITSVTYVLSMFTPFTMGVWTILLNLLFVVLELFLMTPRIIVSWTSGLQTLSVVGKKVRNGVKTLSSPLRGNMEVAGTSWAKCLPRSWASNCMTMNLFAWQPNGVEWMSSIS